MHHLMPPQNRRIGEFFEANGTAIGFFTSVLSFVLCQIGLVDGLVVTNVTLVKGNKLTINYLIVLLDQMFQKHLVG